MRILLAIVVSILSLTSLVAAGGEKDRRHGDVPSLVGVER